MSEAFLDSGYVRNEFIKGAYSQREMAQEFDRWLDSVKADAWDEGKTAGHSIAMRRMSDEPQAPTPHNPYRKQEEA